jgi:hypothetical protein
VDPIERAEGPETVAYGVIPELTRGLRALGSTRAGAALQSQFFHPLLEARRRAAEARSPDARIKAFDAAELRRALDRFVDRTSAGWPDNRESARRALRTELQERVEPYSAALRDLAERATAVNSAPESSRLDSWRAWTAQLVATFQAADRTWSSLRPIVEATRK